MTEQQQRQPGTVVVVGSANVDLTLSVDSLPRAGETVLADGLVRRCGGKGANQAAAAGRLGARVRLVAAVGVDDGSAAVREAASAAGVAVDHLQEVPGAQTGLAVITVDRRGENVIVVAPGANADLSVEAARLGVSDTGSADVIMVSLEIPANTAGAALRGAREHGATTILNPSPFSARVSSLLGWVDVLIMNDGEAESLGDGVAEHDPAIVVTMGGAGARVRMSRRHEWTMISAPVVDVIDTTGCGDAFAGAVAAEVAGGAELISAARLAVRYAALAATRAGAQSSYVDRATLLASELG